MCGSFYFYTMSNRIPFQKPYASAHDLVRLLVTGTGTWVSQVPVETWYNEQLEIVGGDSNTIEQKRLVMLWN